VTPEQLGSFDTIPLPSVADLTYERYGNPRQVRAVDYNLFAQDMFSRWVQSMVAIIRRSGSKQLINVGQDEGGVTNRVLNQFYGLAGVSFTTNHTYWQDDALLWDSVVAKRPGMPNITGETGYQPVWARDGRWRYDEFTGLGLTERKWALGFAAGSSGAMQWDWAREVDFGMQRSDGSAKVWEPMMQRVGEFAQRAAPYATGFVKPDIAIVLPQSFGHSSATERGPGALLLCPWGSLCRRRVPDCVPRFAEAHHPAFIVRAYRRSLAGDCSKSESRSHSSRDRAVCGGRALPRNGKAGSSRARLRRCSTHSP
jgi:hypothetical protein